MDEHSDVLSTQLITKEVARWIVEAMALPSLGMPDGSFTMLLDGEPLLELTARVFDMVQRDAAWQTALDLSYGREPGLPQPTWFDRRTRGPAGYHYEEFPRILREVTAGHSIVRCNFDPGCEWDAEAIVKQRGGDSLKVWKEQWIDHTPRWFQTTAPLPPWHILRAGYAIPRIP
jgi:hypothetical protein